ncbi:MAG TPA: diaminopimelate epimerase [Rhodanobacteraceae bacterium]|nr:diaminopimelate epimerase [Rhodanobacteraceae bacterium]
MSGAWRFTKMHGAGNDFALIDARAGQPLPTADDIARAGDRRRGIGFDQLLSVEPARDTSCAFRYGIWNADGSRAGQCGNGARCVAAWLLRDGALPVDSETRLESPSGPVTVRAHGDGSVRVNMGPPRFAPAAIPLAAPAQAARYALDVDGETVEVAAVSMGNPHAVLPVEDIDAPRWRALAPRITTHPRFPQGCNVGLARVVARDAIELRVHERGAGWTLACGSGACAAVVVLAHEARLDGHVRVTLPGGTLEVDWAGGEAPVWLGGPTCFVYEGRWGGEAEDNGRGGHA